MTTAAATATTAAPSPSATPSATSSPTATAAPVLPLTGEAAPTDQAVRPALVVKIDNTRRARPQIGLGAADLVVEELTEGGITRLAAFYHSELPPLVGPVRSIRGSDIGIVQPTGGVLVASGGAGRVVRAVQAAGVRLAAFEGTGYTRDPARRAPNNLMVRPEDVVTAWSTVPPPPPYLQWGATDPSATASPAGAKVTQVTARFSRQHTTRWSYDGERWRRADELAAPGDEFRPTTLVLLRVQTRDAGYRDPAGNPVPDTVTTGSGEATVLIGDRSIKGRWSKGAADEPWRFTTSAGKPLPIPPGRVWIELVPRAGSVVLS